MAAVPSRLPCPTFSSIKSIPASIHASRTRIGRIPSSNYVRSFSQSCQQQSQMRRDMYAWLMGEGKVYQQAKPGSTNYLASKKRREEEGRREDGNNDASVRRRRGRDKKDDDDASEGYRFPEPESELDLLAQEAAEDLATNAEEQSSEAKVEGIQAEGTSESPVDTAEQDQDANALVRLRNATASSRSSRGDDVNMNPFPLNPFFRSQPVLSDELKEAIYERVKVQGRSIIDVSAQLRVSMERIGAVVRMKQMERDWLSQDKPLAVHYSKAIMDMLPQTPYRRKGVPVPHESINDLPVHPATTQQIFWPTSESRSFTRIDAAEIFKRNLLPADDRIPHPQMVLKRRIESLDSRSERMKMERQAEMKRVDRANQEALLKKKEEESVKVVKGFRWDFRIQDVNVQWAGRDGRGRRGVGWRYGMPHDDRKRGLIKIPTSVD